MARVDRTHLVSNGLDLVPTCCDWAGSVPPPGLPGRSLRILVEDARPHPWRDSVPVESVVGRAVITDRFKYCRYDIGANSEQLYDLESDPGEMHNEMDNHLHRHMIENMKASFQVTFGCEQRLAADVLCAATEA